MSAQGSRDTAQDWPAEFVEERILSLRRSISNREDDLIRLQDELAWWEAGRDLAPVRPVLDSEEESDA